jgi:hypothetical protein
MQNKHNASEILVALSPIGREQEQHLISNTLRSFCIPLKIDPIQSQPVFKINRTIENKMLTIGINPEKKCYSTLKLEIKETAIISEKYELRFEVNLHGMVKVSE